MDHEEKYNTARWDAGQVRREGGERPTHSAQSAASEERRRRNRRKGRERRFLLWLIFVVAVSAILAGVGWLLANDMCAFNKEPLTATIEVTKDDDVNSIATKLKNEGLIEYKWFFKLFGAVRHAGDKIGIGTYELNTDMDYNALIQGMSNRNATINADTVTVTIPEGYSVRQIVSLLAKYGVNSEEALLSAAERGSFDYSFLDSGKSGIARLEGYLFPDTYEFYKNHNAKNALGKLIDAFADHIDEDAFASSKAKSMGYSMKDVVIIASLIEKETDGTDQRDIASVIYTRLQKPGETAGLLQIDASLLYGLPDHTGAITNADKAVDTPYNLYLHKGLPPTAIANPGSAALKAAMDPNDTDYYYYALGTDGKHHFSKTLSEHNAFVGSSSYGG